MYVNLLILDLPSRPETADVVTGKFERKTIASLALSSLSGDN